jgi:molybdopterin molybdotransferase
MALVPPAEALAAMLGAVRQPVGAETVPIDAAAGRTLAGDVTALRTHPAFAVSAMDGYAVRHADLAEGPRALQLIGEAAAGHPFAGRLDADQTVRIFTGAALPEGADAVVMQEDAERGADGRITLPGGVASARHVRPAGLDFREGERHLAAGTVLTPARLSLAASLGHGALSVRRRPVVAIISTGDELTPPGEPTLPAQIVSSNALALAALARSAGAEVRDVGIVRDDRAATRAALAAAAATADLVLTSGGASVGDHDHVHGALRDEGYALGFWKVAIRPGKPVMFAHRDGKLVLGLPGNPVSAYVAALRFALPLIRALLGQPDPARLPTWPARLAAPLPQNDHREDHLRAALGIGQDGMTEATPFSLQDSSMQSVLASADALILRAPLAPAAPAGAMVTVIPLHTD